MSDVHNDGDNIDDLRKVFNICDVGRTGTVGIDHLVELANQYYGSSDADFSKIIETLGDRNDVITFPQFCQVFATFLGSSSGAEHLSDEENSPFESRQGFQSSNDCKNKNRDPISNIPDNLSLLDLPSNIVPNKYQNITLVSQNIDLKIPSEIRMPGDDRGSPSSLSELDSAIGTNTASPSSDRKVHSGCSSMSDREEENFECFGEGYVECDSDSTSVRIMDEIDGSTLLSPPHSLPPSNFGRRNSWVRRSLRCSPSSIQEKPVSPKRWGSFRHAPKRVGGTAVASQLYRTSSFSSGRSSAPDQDDMYSDASLEDDVLDLNHKVQVLQQQVGVLAENQVNTDDRYTRMKEENSTLRTRVNMLEEQLRETEIRADDRLNDEMRRNKELIARAERETQLTIENHSIRHSSLEKEKESISDDNVRLKKEVERLSKERSRLEYNLSDAEVASSNLREENSKISEVSKREKEELRIERERSSQVIEELRCEVQRLKAVEESYIKRSPHSDSPTTPNPELEAELRTLRNENKRLSEQVDELQAQLLTSRLEEGRTLIAATDNNSLAAEFEEMDNDEAAHNSDDVDKLRKSLKDSQEANQHLKSYIDDILLNIVENYPQLLEVKQKRK